MIILNLLLLLISLSNCHYLYENLIKTNFTTCSELNNFLETPCFFETYLYKINAENISYSPPIKVNFSYPQKINYKFIPKIPSIPNFLIKKINIEHNWEKNNNTLNGTIISEFATFNVSTSSKKINDTVYLNLNGNIIKKKIFIPNNIINFMMDQFCEIFSDLLK